MAESNQKGGNDGVAARACVGLRRHPLAFGVMQTLLNATKLFPYFCYGTRRSVFRSVDRYTYERVRDFLARRHKIPGRGTRRFSCEIVYGEHRLLRLERLPISAAPCASR